MNKLRNLLRPKSRKDDDARVTFGTHVRIHDENVRPRTSRDDFEINSTACYHTKTTRSAPRGPKSWAGGLKDQFDTHERSFGTEIHRRRASPDYPRDSTRQRRANRIRASDYAGSQRDRDDVSVANTHFTYTRERYENDTDDEQGQLFDDMRKRLKYAEGRHAYYKNEARAMRKAMESNEREMRRKEEEIRRKDELIMQLQAQLRTPANFAMSASNTMFGAGFPVNFPYQPYCDPFPSNQTGSSIVADPQPTRNDIMPFDDEPKDEVKVFRCTGSSCSIRTEDNAEMSLLNHVLN